MGEKMESFNQALPPAVARAVKRYRDVDAQVNYIFFYHLNHSIKNSTLKNTIQLLSQKYELTPDEIKMIEKAFHYGFVASGVVSTLLGVSQPTARKRIIQLAQKLGIKPRRTHTRFSWYCITRTALIHLASTLN